MFSSFSKFLPTNVNITTPDFLKSVTNNTNHSPEPSSSPTDGKHRNVLTKQHKFPVGGAGDSEAHTSNLETASVNESENAHNVDNTTASKPGKMNESRSKRRKDATATETFYIVRPPPSKTNHPLNLQVQLLATSGRERVERRRASVSSTRSESGANGLTRSTTGSRETLNDTEEGNGLKRTASRGSTRSDTESIYSAASTSSTVASGTSSSSGRRMIPLYNLNAHNVMTNSIADAGTDAKIAKFFKRGLEIMGLAVLEPVEVYGKYTWDDGWDSLYPNGRGTAVSRTVSHISNRSMQRAISPAGSGIFSSNVADGLEPVIEVPSSPTTPKPPTSTTEKADVGKKLFGGIFNKKKKETPTPQPLALISSRDTTSTEGGVRSSKRNSTAIPVSSPIPNIINLPETPTTTSGFAEVQLQPQILGLQAVLQSPVNPPKGRPTAYVWVVRRWIRGADEGFLGIGAMVESLHLGMNNPEKGAPHGQGMEVEVRFEWKRCAKGKMGAPSKDKDREGKDKRTRRHSIASEGKSAVPMGVGTSPGLLDPSSAMDGPSSSPASKRLSFQGFGLGKKSPQITPPNEHANGSNDHLKVSRAPSPNPPASITTVGTNEESTTGHGGAGGGTSKSTHNANAIVEDDESDSDIEDSERPWNCYLHIRAPPSSRQSSRDELSQPSNTHGADTGRSSRSNKEKTLDIRLRIAALAPAPHHPKVIAQIKTPYPLPDVLFDAQKTSAELRMRGEDESLSNLAESITGGSRGAKPVVLSSEDVKDVVSCTGLWLVVREGYGGLARKRKGDGWRLRG